MNKKMIDDTNLIDEMILDILLQACENEGEIDNQCLKPYEEACDYLAEKGWIKTLNGRIYTVNHISESRKTLKGGNKNE